MISSRSEFKLQDRGFDKTLVLIPGWATDYRVFSQLKSGYNYLFVIRANLDTFLGDLNNFLENNHISKVSILGYSLGGFIAKDFALKYQKMIDKLFLVSIRKQYTKIEIDTVSELMKKNKAAFLFKFYKDCFCGKDDGFVYFKQNLLKIYVEDFKLDALLTGLEYLGKVFVAEEELKVIKNVTVFSSRLDKIAPFKESQGLTSFDKGIRFVALENSGHMPFLGNEFNEKFNG